MKRKSKSICSAVMAVLLSCLMLVTYTPVNASADESVPVQQTETSEEAVSESQSSDVQKPVETQQTEEKSAMDSPDSEKPEAESVASEEESEEAIDSKSAQNTVSSEESEASQTTEQADQKETTMKEESAVKDQSSEESTEKSSNEHSDAKKALSMPAIDAMKTTTNQLTVTVHAAAGIFPDGTSFKITPVSAGTAIQAAEPLFEEPVVDAAAVDISFIGPSGVEIEPADGKQVQIGLHAENAVDGDNHEVIHITDDGTAETVDSVNRVTGASAQFSAGSFSVYAIVGTDKANIPTETYEFYNSDGKLVSSQTVKKGDTLLEPKVPETLNGKAFSGWKDSSNNTFDGFGVIGNIAQDGAKIQLHANYQDAIYLYYYDQYDNLIKSQPVTPNSTVTIAADMPLVQVQPLTECQDGWSTVQGGTVDVSGSFTFGMESVKLYPILKEGYWVDFQTNSESSIARQFISRNAEGTDRQVKKPETNPVKQGYVFDQWYADQDLSKPYDFTQKVTKPLTLYAGYKPASDTEYTVRYWIEYQKEPGTGVGDGTWDYKFLAVESRKGVTGEAATFDENLIFTEPYGLSAQAYEINNEKTTTPKIEADGSTVFDVYYQCKKYDLSIVIPLANGKSTQLSYKQVKYSSSLANFWDEVFSNRPEGELFDGSHRFFYYLPSGGVEFVESASQLSSMPSKNAALFIQGLGKSNSYYKFFLESLHGKAPDGKTTASNQSIRADGDTRTYYLQVDGYFTSGAFGCIDVTTSDFTGFTPIMEHSDGHYALLKSGNGARVWFRYSNKNLHLAMNADGTQHMYNGPDNPIRIYYKRNIYPLIFHTGGGPKVEDQNVLYEDSLSQFNPSAYIANQTAIKQGNEEFVFAGWYTDSEYTKPFDFNSTMPAYELDLYAKWVPKTYTVTFDTGKGSSVEKITNVRYGVTVAKPEEPTYEGHIFLGWTLEGRPYSFESGVTENIVLKAEWRSIDAWCVQYDLNGGSGACPSDDKKYYENAGVTVAPADDITAPVGMVLLGWKSSGDGRLYYPNASAPMAFGGMTFTAQWGTEEKTTKLTYDFNFEQFGIHVDGKTYETVFALKNNSKITLADISSLCAVPAGYKFKGWYLDKSCETEPLQKVLVDRLQENGNRVYAKWIKVYSVTYKDGAGGSLFKDQTYTMENGQKTPDFNGTPKRDGYAFKGWSPKISDTVNCDVIYTAKWEKIGQTQGTEASEPDKASTTPSTSVQKTSSSPKTGDDTNLIIYNLAMAVGLVLIIAILFLRKKYGYKNN